MLHFVCAMRSFSVWKRSSLYSTAKIVPRFFMMDAKWVVLFPGAAHMSNTMLPLGGSRKYDDRQLAC